MTHHNFIVSKKRNLYLKYCIRFVSGISIYTKNFEFALITAKNTLIFKEVFLLFFFLALLWYAWREENYFHNHIINKIRLQTQLCNFSFLQKNEVIKLISKVYEMFIFNNKPPPPPYKDLHKRSSITLISSIILQSIEQLQPWHAPPYQYCVIVNSFKLQTVYITTKQHRR